MKYNVSYKCRNYNFLELIRSYNNLIENHKSNEPIDNVAKYALTQNLLGDASVETICEALLYDGYETETESLGLLEKGDDGKYYLSKNKKILPPPTKEETAYINYLLNNGSFDLFLNNGEKKLLQDNISLYFKNVKMQIPDFSKHFIKKGDSASADELLKIKNNFDMLNKAIKNDKAVCFTYFYNGKYETITAKPASFVFSQLDRRMKAKMHIDSCLKTFYLANMTNLKETEHSVKTATGQVEISELVFICKNEANIVERVTARFSDYQKEVHFKEKNNTIEYHIFYNDNVNEHNRIMIRLRYLSSRIDVKSKEVIELKREAQKTLALYKKQ